jgi:hypothetical protein
MEVNQIKELLGKSMVSVINRNDVELIFTDTDGIEYIFYHEQCCCENVQIEEIIGDLKDLVESPIVLAEERIQDQEELDVYEYQTWTFYEFSTVKGSVTVRWLGESNGYYSESVYFKVVKPEEKK